MANKITQYIYLIHTREFYNHDEFVYKIGKTKKLNFHRFNQYPRGSVLLFQTNCNDCDICETKILKLFNSKYKRRKDIGLEYFEGDYLQMKKDICNIVDNNVDVKVEPKIVKKKIKKVVNKVVNKVINKVKEIKKNNIIEQKIIDTKCEGSRTCPNPACKSTFKYPSGLKRHFTLSVICKKNNNDIKLYFQGFKQPKLDNYKCDKCNTLYTNKSSLTRHIRNTKCNILTTAIT